MTQEEIDILKDGHQTILLETGQFINVKHSDLPEAVNITWSHETHELHLSCVDNEEFLSLNRPISLEKKNILILNYEHPGHERVYRLDINSDNGRIKLVELNPKPNYSLDLRIYDDQ